MADILVIDDDQNLGLALQMTLTQEGHQCRLANDVETGWDECQRQSPDLALLDLQLPDGDGLELLSRLREQGLELPIIIMTAFGTVTNAVSAMKRGAADFIEKPMSVKEVCQLVVRLLNSRELVRQLEDNEGEPTRSGKEAEEILGQCPAIKDVLATAQRIAGLPVESGIGLAATLLLGETGTGKELVARRIHALGSGKDKPFIHVNCTAIPETLFEMEHFGHERGVFTDAKTSKQGLFEAADGGTLFLDEVGDLPLGMQGKLLVAIETGRFRRVGATEEKSVSVRVVAATNCNLEEKVRAGEFRSDFYHRLKLFEIALPPLRERGDDLDLLADHFLTRFSRKLHRPKPDLTPQAVAAMRAYPWPGNVRELAHCLMRALVTYPDSPLTAEALGIESSAAAAAGNPPGELEFDFTGGALPLAQVERKLVQAALDHADGNVAEAARLLGMTRGTLRYRLEKLGLI